MAEGHGRLGKRVRGPNFVYRRSKKLRKEQQSEEAAGAPLDTPERRIALTGARKVVARRGKKKTFKARQSEFSKGKKKK